MSITRRKWLLSGCAAVVLPTDRRAEAFAFAIPVAQTFMYWVLKEVATAAIQWAVGKALDTVYSKVSSPEISAKYPAGIADAARAMGPALDAKTIQNIFDRQYHREASDKLVALVDKQRAYLRSPAARASQAIVYVNESMDLVRQFGSLGLPGLAGSLTATSIQIAMIWELVRNANMEPWHAESANIRDAIQQAQHRFEQHRKNGDAIQRINPPQFEKSYAHHLRAANETIGKLRSQLDSQGLWNPQGQAPAQVPPRTEPPDNVRDAPRELLRIAQLHLIVARSYPGRALDTDGPFERGGRWLYRIKWLTPDGRVSIIYADAMTGQILQRYGSS